MMLVHNGYIEAEAITLWVPTPLRVVVHHKNLGHSAQSNAKPDLFIAYNFQ